MRDRWSHFGNLDPPNIMISFSSFKQPTQDFSNQNGEERRYRIVLVVFKWPYGAPSRRTEREAVDTHSGISEHHLSEKPQALKIALMRCHSTCQMPLEVLAWNHTTFLLSIHRFYSFHYKNHIINNLPSRKKQGSSRLLYISHCKGWLVRTL